MIYRIIIILAWQHLLLCWWLVIRGPDTELGRRWILNRRQMAWPYTLLYRIVRCSLGMEWVPEIRDCSGCSLYHIQHYSLLREKHVCTISVPIILSNLLGMAQLAGWNSFEGIIRTEIHAFLAKQEVMLDVAYM